MSTNRYRLRELEALRAIVTTGTTVGASRRLGISQSGVSRAVSQLEARVGRMLFLRRSGRIEPTEEALRLNERLDPIFDTLAEIEGAKWAAVEDKPLRLAVPPSFAYHFIMSRLARFLEQNPNRRVDFDIQPSDAMIAGILEERFDLGLTGTKVQRSGVTLLPWRKSSLVCAMPEGHALAQRDIVKPEDLDGQSFISFLRRLGIRGDTEQLFAHHGVAPQIIASTATNISALELVRAGLGLAILNPFPLLVKDYAGIVVRPFDAAITYHTSFVIPTGRPATTAARQFMSLVRMTTPKDDYSEAV